jgi:hypothetical protein
VSSSSQSNIIKCLKEGLLLVVEDFDQKLLNLILPVLKWKFKTLLNLVARIKNPNALSSFSLREFPLLFGS